MTINNISTFHHVAMTVRDGAKSAQWYREVFGFELVQKFTRAWLVGKGSCNLGLTELPNGHPVEELNAKIAIHHIAFHGKGRDGSIPSPGTIVLHGELGRKASQNLGIPNLSVADFLQENNANRVDPVVPHSSSK
jgi:hypothetical protein